MRIRPQVLREDVQHEIVADVNVAWPSAMQKRADRRGEKALVPPRLAPAGHSDVNCSARTLPSCLNSDTEVRPNVSDSRILSPAFLKKCELFRVRSLRSFPIL